MTDSNPSTTIIGISGSLRKESCNAALLRAAADLAPSTTRVEIASIREIPLYNADIDAEQGAPDSVLNLKDRIAASAGLLLVTPEYNNSIPGVFKNAIDSLSRPPADIPRVFKGRPVALMGCTPGRNGAILAQNAWLPVLRAMIASRCAATNGSGFWFLRDCHPNARQSMRPRYLGQRFVNGRN
jgi:chromate reductase, NAD(P)H dehydrogenase (quinone)